VDLALLVDAEDHGMGRRIDIEANDILELLGEFGVVGELERAHPMRLERLICRYPICIIGFGVLPSSGIAGSRSTYPRPQTVSM
jgi:hypothetical protein